MLRVGIQSVGGLCGFNVEAGTLSIYRFTSAGVCCGFGGLHELSCMDASGYGEDDVLCGGNRIRDGNDCRVSVAARLL